MEGLPSPHYQLEKNKRQKQTFERGKELVYWQMPWDNNSSKTRLAFPPPKSYHESESESAQSCLTLCNPMDCSLLGSSIHGIFQARILEWVAMSFSRGSSRPRGWTWVSHMQAESLLSEPPGKALNLIIIATDWN